MKWFKHYSDTLHSQEMQLAISRHGFRVFGLYCAILETIAASFTTEQSLPSLTLPLQKWCQILHTKPRVLRSFGAASAQMLGCYFEPNGKLLRIDCPKLLILKDEHTRKSGVTQEQLRSNSRLDIDIDNTTPLTPLHRGEIDLFLDDFNVLNDRSPTKLQQNDNRKNGKKAHRQNKANINLRVGGHDSLPETWSDTVCYCAMCDLRQHSTRCMKCAAPTSMIIEQ